MLWLTRTLLLLVIICRAREDRGNVDVECHLSVQYYEIYNRLINALRPSSGLPSSHILVQFIPISYDDCKIVLSSTLYTSPPYL